MTTKGGGYAILPQGKDQQEGSSHRGKEANKSSCYENKQNFVSTPGGSEIANNWVREKKWQEMKAIHGRGGSPNTAFSRKGATGVRGEKLHIGKKAPLSDT